MIFYQYKATVISVVDGDTIRALIDVGLDAYYKKYVRLHGINALELNSTDPDIRTKAQAAKLFLMKILPVGSEFWINSKKLDPYRRPIAEIFLPNQTISINEQMIAAGHAVSYL